MEYSFSRTQGGDGFRVVASYMSEFGHQLAICSRLVAISDDPSGRAKSKRAMTLCKKYVSETRFRHEEGACIHSVYYKDVAFVRRFRAVADLVSMDKTDEEIEHELVLIELGM